MIFAFVEFNCDIRAYAVQTKYINMMMNLYSPATFTHALFYTKLFYREYSVYCAAPFNREFS